jgi:hypothetical protein
VEVLVVGVRTTGRWLATGMAASAIALVLAVSGTAAAAAVGTGATGPVPRASLGTPGMLPASAEAGSAGVLAVLPELYGVSCPSATWCMAVGWSDAGFTGASGIWDGHGWKWLPDPAPSGKLAVFKLSSVSCVSPVHCVAVGYGPYGIPVGVLWNGRAWTFMPWIANRRTISTNAVSCVTATYCVVAGDANFTDRSGAALLWNGTSWRRLGPALPAGADSIDFSSISCVSTTACLAVGSYQIGTAAYPVAESWNGSTWTIYSVPLGIVSLVSVSCPKADLCLADGTGDVTGHAQEPATVRWNGSRLTALATPSPGGLLPALSGISCASAASCVAVGITNVDAPFAEQWTAKAGWALLHVPALAGLFAVSCPKPTACLATGDYFNAEFWGDATVLSWDGSTWHVIRQDRTDVLDGVSCPDRSACLATGVYLSTSDGVAALAEAWNGRGWRQASPPDVPGGTASVSCVTRTFCMAAGYSGAALWNGRKWSPAGQPDGDFGAVSCVTTRFCMDTNGATYAVWRGQAWRDIPPTGGTDADFGIGGTSCASSTLCLGFGTYFDSDGNPDGAFVDRWNGRTWQLASIPAIASAQIYALSCARGSWCIAIGINDGQPITLRLSAGKWLITNMPALPDATDYATMSCASASMCMAISGNVSALWNGRNWRLGKVADVPGELFGISCTGPAFCMATGQRAGLLSLTERWNGHDWKALTEPNP